MTLPPGSPELLMALAFLGVLSGCVLACWHDLFPAPPTETPYRKWGIGDE